MRFEPSQIQFNLSPRFGRESQIFTRLSVPFFSGRSPNDFQFLLPTETSSRVMHRSVVFFSYFSYRYLLLYFISSIFDVLRIIEDLQFIFVFSFKPRSFCAENCLRMTSTAILASSEKIWCLSSVEGEAKDVRDTPPWGKQQSNWISWKTPSRLIERVLELWFRLEAKSWGNFTSSGKFVAESFSKFLGSQRLLRWRW